MKHSLLCLLAWLIPVGLATAMPGEGPRLTITTGVVYNVTDLTTLSTALNAANAAAVPATILLADNTYQLGSQTLVVRCRGLILRSQSGNRDAVIIRGPDEGPTATLAHAFLIESNDVTIADVTLGYCRYHGVQIRGEPPYHVSGTRIHNCRLVNCNEQFIKGSSGASTVAASNGLIAHCLFEFTSGWSYQYYTGGIDIHRGVNWHVHDNLFRGIRNPTDLPGIAEHAIHFWKRAAEPQNIIVERNWIINCDRGIGFGLSNFDGGFTGGNSIIRNNMVINDGAGGHTDVAIGLEAASGVRVDNNTAYVPSYWAPIEYRFASSTNLQFRNNLVNSPIRLRNDAPPAALANNIESVEADWFADIPAGDLRLTAQATPAIDGGAPLADVVHDLFGNARPVGAAWDVGAHEFNSTDLDADGLPDVWEVQYFGAVNVTDGSADADADGFDDQQEWLAGTNPIDAASKLTLAITRLESGVRLTWPSIADRTYTLYSQDGLNTNTWSGWVVAAADLAATPPLNTVNMPAGSEALTFRIGVGNE